MNRHLIIALFLMSSCIQKESDNVSTKILGSDSSFVITTLGQIEQTQWAFFQELEMEIKKQEPTFSESEIVEYIEDMIDNRLVSKPTIYIDTEGSTDFKVVDYGTYRKFRLENPIDTNRAWTSTEKISKEDSLKYIREESTKLELIRIFKPDSLR